MKRVLIPMTLVALVALSAAALAKPHRKQHAKLKLGNTSIGKIVENGGGFTLYMFSKDKPGKDKCKKVSGCLAIWPPVTTQAKVNAAPGINPKLIGTIKLSKGKKQVTYNGHPLYRYIGDSGPGQTSYNGIFQSGGRWYALDGNGNAVK